MRFVNFLTFIEYKFIERTKKAITWEVYNSSTQIKRKHNDPKISEGEA